jgi:hypothetical protein
MLLEDDGKNKAQLVRGANVVNFVKRAMTAKARLPTGHRLNWFEDRQTAALILWILWMTQSEGSAILLLILNSSC